LTSPKICLKKLGSLPKMWVSYSGNSDTKCFSYKVNINQFLLIHSINSTKRALRLGCSNQSKYPTRGATIGEKFLCNKINVIMGPLRHFLAAFWKINIFSNDMNVLKNYQKVNQTSIQIIAIYKLFVTVNEVLYWLLDLGSIKEHQILSTIKIGCLFCFVCYSEIS